MSEKKTRRDFLTEQFQMFAVGALFSWPLSKLVRVRPRKQAPPPPQRPTIDKTAALRKKKDYPTDPLAAPFIGENLHYDVTFLWVVNAAEGIITFHKDGPNYVGTMIARVKGVVGWLTAYKSQKFLSRMRVKTINGVRRFVTHYHARYTTKNDTVHQSVHSFNFEKDKWYNKRFKNGKKTKSRTRKLKGRILDDFVAVNYNFRAGAYGKIEKGRSYTVQTLPYKKIDRFTFKVATDEEMATDKKWVANHPGGTLMVIVKVDQKVFGIKTGEARILGNDKKIPLAGYIKDATSFGNVYADLSGSGKSTPDKKPEEAAPEPTQETTPEQTPEPTG
jgi:Protein of unknown function (DUF3108)